MNIELTFDAEGIGRCLHTEAIDLEAIGTLEIQRASNVEFNNESQQWEVIGLDGTILHHDKSRAACIQWEASNVDILRAHCGCGPREKTH